MTPGHRGDVQKQNGGGCSKNDPSLRLAPDRRSRGHESQSDGFGRSEPAVCLWLRPITGRGSHCLPASPAVVRTMPAHAGCYGGITAADLPADKAISADQQMLGHRTGASSTNFTTPFYSHTRSTRGTVGSAPVRREADRGIYSSPPLTCVFGGLGTEEFARECWRSRNASSGRCFGLQHSRHRR